MKDWHSEEEIKAQLRELTAETRKLRHELDDLIRPTEPRSGGFQHRHYWPQPSPDDAASDRKRSSRKKR